MKIGFDAKRITHNSTGLGNYSRFVVNILSTFYPENSYYLYSPSKGKERLRGQIKAHSNIFFRYPLGIAKTLKSLWRSYGIISDLQKDRIEVFHGLSNELPFHLKKKNIKSVVTIHDLIFIRYPEFYKPIDRHIYTYKFKKACQNADVVIAISEMTKQDIIRFFKIPEKKIKVIYQGCDPSFSRKVTLQEKQSLKEKYHLPDKFILNVGSIESRKNLLLIIKALKYADYPVPLVVIGKPTPYIKQVEQYLQKNSLQSQVIFLHHVPFTDLPGIYQNASLFIYPSFFEGFGIPILEALASEVPVIAATGSCLEEAGGPGSIYINPRDEKQLAEKINEVLSNPELSQKMIETGKDYMQNFSAKTLSDQLMEVYMNL
ncbi:glycosyltransferase family 4 protein [Parabacteroides pacaensis]|uniref:glycosyltransferase family 4 protein n=1 Tax=Parabacteroides pacaensis TaxID=2086575 RepID=UPI000D1037C3|nr:glycosyltransferase family 1 protein [Parabacteroides pacaensis]